MSEEVTLILWSYIFFARQYHLIYDCCIEDTVNEIQVIDCTLELTFRCSSDILTITELTVLDS